jgi:uncharacterized protein
MVEAAREQMWAPTPAMIAKELAGYRGGWGAQMRYRVPDALQMETVFFVLFTFWRATGLMLIGMALFKLGVFAGRLRGPDYWTMIYIAVCLGIPVILYGTHRDVAGGWQFRSSLFIGSDYGWQPWGGWRSQTTSCSR